MNTNNTISTSSGMMASRYHQCQAKPVPCDGIAEPLGWFCPDTCRPDNSGAKFAGSVLKVFFARFHEILPPVKLWEMTSPSTF
jgi:hypothetical protein